MVTATPATPAIPRALILEVCGRLGNRESSVEPPSWTVAFQQLHLPPSPLQEPTVHHDRPEQRLRFAGCEPERQVWLNLLPKIEPNVARIDRFRSCGAFSLVHMDDETGAPFLVANTCKLRVCPACRKAIQRKTFLRILDFLHSAPAASWQFHTYTLRHTNTPLTDQLDRLVHSFRLLRHRKAWKQACQAGYAVIEITFHQAGTWSPNGRQREYDEWHPHLHVLVQTQFINWSAVHTAWREITRDSTGLDFKQANDLSKAAGYVAKYLGKPPDLDFANTPEHAAEYYLALNNRRLLMPFGPAAKHTLPPPAPARPSTYVCKFSELHTAVTNGDPVAQAILTFIALAMKPPQQRTKPKQQHELPYERGPPT